MVEYEVMLCEGAEWCTILECEVELERWLLRLNKGLGAVVR